MAIKMESDSNNTVNVVFSWQPQNLSECIWPYGNWTWHRLMTWPQKQGNCQWNLLLFANPLLVLLLQLFSFTDISQPALSSFFNQ